MESSKNAHKAVRRRRFVLRARRACGRERNSPAHAYTGEDRFNGINSRSKNWYNLAAFPASLSRRPFPSSFPSMPRRSAIPAEEASPGPFYTSHCICASVPEILIPARQLGSTSTVGHLYQRNTTLAGTKTPGLAQCPPIGPNTKRYTRFVFLLDRNSWRGCGKCWDIW